jgi:hypothetical protein
MWQSYSIADSRMPHNRLKPLFPYLRGRGAGRKDDGTFKATKYKMADRSQNRSINMKKVNAELSYNVEVYCPYCNKLLELIASDASDIILDAIESNDLCDLGLKIRCYRCDERFELNDIDK